MPHIGPYAAQLTQVRLASRLEAVYHFLTIVRQHYRIGSLYGRPDVHGFGLFSRNHEENSLQMSDATALGMSTALTYYEKSPDRAF